MASKKLAIAISVYDKFEDIEILTDLIRNNWEGDFEIIVCSSHRDPFPHLKHCPIDQLIVTEDIPFDPKNFPPLKRKLHFTMRVTDSIRKACTRAALSQAPYSMHVHADACPLSWPSVEKLIHGMAQRSKTFAARGEGMGLYTPSEPVGAFDDMFFFFENAFARDAELWDFEILDFQPHKLSVHGILATLIMTRVGLKRFHHYAAHTNSVYWDGKTVFQHPLNASIPMYYDPSYHFLHIHEVAFPDNLGMNLKAYYLKKCGATKGPVIEKFIRKWDMDEAALFAKLKKMEQDYHAFFNKRGLTMRHFGRNFHLIEKMKKDYLALGPAGRLAWLGRHHAFQLKDLITRPIKEAMAGKPVRAPYTDMIWPRSMNTLYQSELDPQLDGIREFSPFRFDPSN